MEACKSRKDAFLSGEIYAGDILEIELTNERERENRVWPEVSSLGKLDG